MLEQENRDRKEEREGKKGREREREGERGREREREDVNCARQMTHSCRDHQNLKDGKSKRKRKKEKENFKNRRIFEEDEKSEKGLEK